MADVKPESLQLHQAKSEFVDQTPNNQVEPNSALLQQKNLTIPVGVTEDVDSLAAMRKRMEQNNEVGVFKEEINGKPFWQRIKEKMPVIQGAKFECHNKQLEHDIRSLWILHGNWWIRKKIVWLTSWPQFENFITIVILANSVMLACTDYNDRILGPDYVSIRNLNMGQVDTAFSIIFLCECILKILSMGFFLHKKSYLRDPWNWLDFFVVTVSVITWLPGISSNSSMKSLRTFRILRPLRSINSMPSMKALIQSLLSSLPGLFNVGIFLTFIFTIFAIFGTHQFQGSQYQLCRLTREPIFPDNSTTDPNLRIWPIAEEAAWLCNTDADCERQLGPGDDKVYKCGALVEYGIPLAQDNPSNQTLIFYDIIGFNNVAQSFFTIFQCLTLEGWTLVMYNYMDSNNPYISAGFFCFMVIFGSFFAMQLVLANIMDSFAKDQEMKKKNLEMDVEEELEKKELRQNALKALQGAGGDSSKIEGSKVGSQQSRQVQGSTDIVVLQVVPSINNNAQIDKKLQTSKEDEKNQKKAQLEADKDNLKLDLSDVEDNVQNNNNQKNAIEDWTTNKKESFPIEQQPDSDDEFEDETQYEILARDRSKRNPIYLCFYNMVNHPFYNFVVFVLIVSNTATLAVDDYPQSLRKEYILSCLNDFFTWAFTVEMLMKMFALGLNNYIHDNFNLFDAVVVSLSLIDWSLDLILTPAQKASVGSSMQALRALRLLRVVKLARSWTKLQDIIRKTLMSLKDISNFGVLLFLFLYIYALLGMDLFANQIRWDWQQTPIADIPAAVAQGQIMFAPHYNFDDIFNSLVVTFCAIMAEDWNNSFYSFVQSGAANFYVVLFFFLTLMILGNIMLLSLFTAILLQNFDTTEEEMQAMANKPKSDFKVSHIFTKKFLLKAWAGIIGIFETRSKRKKQKEENKQITPTPAKVDQKKKPAEQPIKIVDPDAANPEGDPLGLLELGLKSSEAIKKQQNVMAVISLLHYELNEAQLGVSSTAKKTQQELPPLHGYSFFLMGPHNSFRQTCQEVSEHKVFGGLIILAILISTLSLALQTPFDDPYSQLSVNLNYLDFVMTGLFISEMMTKIFAYGFAFCGKNSYIRNPWNILDFLIVASATISVIFSNIDLGFIKSLRVLRVLRPLRLIAKHRGLRLAISALFNSLPNIGNLLLIMLFVIFMVAILCITLFSGTFWSCQFDHLPNLVDYVFLYGITNRYECLMFGGEWVNKDFNYDNLPQSMLSLISTQSTEGWVDNMWVMISITSPEMQPDINSKRYYQLFAIACVFLLTLLFLNLFVGVVIESFNNEKDNLSLNFKLKKFEAIWIDNLKLCYSAKPKITTPSTGKKFRDFMIKVCDHESFSNFILICIIGNTISLTIKWYGQSQTSLDQLENVNYFFAAVFTVEAVMKIIAYRKNYFRENWNRFDFAVVLLTWVVNIIMSFSLPFDVSILGMIARTLRIGRIFRIVRRVPAIQIILKTLLEAIPAISALGLLLGLLFFMYAIIGMSQFAFVALFDQINEHANFQSFPAAVLTLMRDTTGEAWDSIMYDCMRQRQITFLCDPDFDYYSWLNNGKVVNGCGTPIAVAYFYSFTVIVSQIFLNLFIAIIIDSFLDQSKSFGMPVNQTDIDDFIDVWNKYDPNGNGTINCHEFEKFVAELARTPTKLIANKKRILKSVTRRRMFISDLEIPSHNSFSDFLFVDVLMCMSRLIVEADYVRHDLYEHKILLKDLAKQSEQQGVKPNTTKIAEENPKKDSKVDFKNLTNGISKLDKNIESVGELLKIANKLSSKQLGAIDINKLEEDAHEIYSSKHYIYGELIVKCWRDFLQAKADDIQKAESKGNEGDRATPEVLNQQSMQDNSQTELIRIEENQAVAK